MVENTSLAGLNEVSIIQMKGAFIRVAKPIAIDEKMMTFLESFFIDSGLFVRQTEN